MMANYCRVCWQGISTPTRRGEVPDHFDSVGRSLCPASGEPFAALTAEDRREQVAITAADVRAGVLVDAFEKLLAS